MNIVTSLVSVAQTSVALFAATTASRRVTVSNFSANNITVSTGTAVASTGVIIGANSSHTFDTTEFTQSSGGRQYVPALNAISATGTNAVGVAYYTE